MKDIHVECKPDEKLVLKLGFTRKTVTHHPGKSRVFNKLSKSTNQLAMVDEDPGSAKTTYEKNLRLVDESEGIKFYSDNSNNKIFILKGKLEDWIVDTCKKHDIMISKFGLPEDPNDMHDVINQRLIKFGALIDHLIKENNPPIIKLKSWLFNKG